jgi:hypothetical protein
MSVRLTIALPYLVHQAAPNAAETYEQLITLLVAQMLSRLTRAN